MFQSLMVTGLTPLCNTDEIHHWDNKPFIGKWPANQRTSIRGTEVTKTIKKKPKRVRTSYTTEQLRALESIYAVNKYIDGKRRKVLSDTLNIGDRAIKIWFQNRRMKEKKESSESSCDSSTEIKSCQSPLIQKSLSPTVKDNVKPGDLNYVPNLNFSGSNPTYEQYQFPTFYYNENMPECQNGYPYFQNGAGFGVDTSVYPTQYYPCHEGYNNAHFDTYGYGTAQYANDADNWYAKSFDLSYF